MDRIKDIKKLKLFKGGILLELHEKKKRLIHTLDETNTTYGKDDINFSHAEVIAVADNVTWIELGDIILDFGSAEVFAWNDKKYCIVLDMTINILTPKSNFDSTKVKELAS